MLEGVPEPRDNSRLCCQIRMTAELDGVVVHLPKDQV
jgi:2Fe-2S ferredoxin